MNSRGDDRIHVRSQLETMENNLQNLENDFRDNPSKEKLFNIVNQRRSYLSSPFETNRIPNIALSTVLTRIDFFYLGASITEDEAQKLLENENNHKSIFDSLLERANPNYQSKSL